MFGNCVILKIQLLFFAGDGSNIFNKYIKVTWRYLQS